LWQNQTIHCRYFDTAQKGNHSNFLTPTVVGEWCPFWNLRWKWPPLETCWHPLISADNVSAVRYSKNSSIMTNRKLTVGFPTSYRWSVYVTPKSPKGWHKKRFCWIKLNFNRIKSATKFLWVKTFSGRVVL